MGEVEVTRAEDCTPFQPLYGDVYCSRSGAGQARDVFVVGAGLPRAEDRGPSWRFRRAAG